MTRIRNHETHPNWVGRHVEIQYCIGKYGQTRRVHGTVQQVDIYGGVYLVLDDDTVAFRDWPIGSKTGVLGYPGRTFYIPLAHEALRTGIYKFKDFEHGHTVYIKEIQDA